MRRVYTAIHCSQGRRRSRDTLASCRNKNTIFVVVDPSLGIFLSLYTAAGQELLAAPDALHFSVLAFVGSGESRLA